AEDGIRDRNVTGVQTCALPISLVSKQGDISKLAAGSKELNEGTKTLKSSLVSKQGDISELAAGSKELNEGTGELLGNLNNKSSRSEERRVGKECRTR